MAFGGLRLAVGTLTILPSGPVGEIDRPTAARAMLLAPLAVLPLALATVLVGLGAVRLGLPAPVNGLAMVAVLALGTRALHLDGLADTIDGLGAGWDRERSLSIMRRGDIGPMGVVALVITLGLQTATLGRLVADLPGAVVAALLVVSSRAALGIVCRVGVPAARPNGLGAAVAGSVPRGAAVGVWAVLLVGAAGAAGLGWASPALLLGFGLAVVAVAVLVRVCVRRLGGVTGDVMGASIELALTVLLLAAAARP